MNETYEIPVNLPESILDELENDSPIYGVLEEDMIALGAPDDVPGDAFLSAIKNLKEKESVKGAKIKRESKKSSIKVKTPKKSKSKSSKSSTAPKGVSNKQKELDKIAMTVSSSEATQIYNEETGKHDVSIILESVPTIVYSFKGKPKSGWGWNILNNTPSGRGAKLKAADIKTLRVISKVANIDYVLTKGEDKPKKEKKVKPVKTLTDKSSSKIKSEKTFKTYKVTAYGRDSFKGLTKEGIAVNKTPKYTFVDFKSRKGDGTTYNITFLNSDGSQVDARPYHSWSLKEA
jgi:hypothetical protein